MQSRLNDQNAKRTRLRRRVGFGIAIVILMLYVVQQVSSLDGYKLLVWKHYVREDQPTYTIHYADNRIAYVFPGESSCTFLGGLTVSEVPQPDEKVMGVFYGVWLGGCPLFMPPESVLDANRGKHRF